MIPSRQRVTIKGLVESLNVLYHLNVVSIMMTFSFRDSEIKIVHSGKLIKSVPISKFKTRPKMTNIIGVTLKPQFVDRD